MVCVCEISLPPSLPPSLLRDTLPVYIKQLHQFSSTTTTGLSGSEARRITGLLGLVESAFHLAAITPSQLKIGGESSAKLPTSSVKWSHMAGLLDPLLRGLVSWTQACAQHTPSQDTLLVLGALLNAVATYYTKLKRKVPFWSSCSCYSSDALSLVHTRTQGWW